MAPENNNKLKGYKLDFSIVFKAFAQIAKLLTTDSSRIFALFLLLPLTAIVVFIFAPQTPLVAGAILTLVLISGCMTLYLLRDSTKRKRRTHTKKPSLASRLGTFGLLSVISLLLFVLLHQVGIFQKLFPRLYPEIAAVEVVQEFYNGLGGVLAATSNEERANAFQEFTKSMTPDYRKRTLPKGCAEVLSKLDSSPDDAELREQLEKHAKTYAGWYGHSNRAYVDLIGSSSWQRIEKSHSRQVLYVIAIVRFTGRFTENTFPNSKMRVRDLAIAMSDPDSRQRLQLVRWLEEQFPSMDRSEMETILGQLYVTDMGEANAFDLVQYRIGVEKLGSRSDSPYRFGNEVSLVSIRLEMDTSVDHQWRIAEIGRWGMKRVFTEDPPPDSNFSVDRRLTVKNVPYYAQKTSSLCQSACLQMVAEHLDAKNGNFNQKQIRTSLETIGNPLAHSVRVKWLAQELPAYTWTMQYVTSLPETVKQIRNQLSKGVPVILSTRLTPSGHVIVVTGIWYNSAGAVIVRVHDPWGRFDFKTLQYNTQIGMGRDVEYPLSQLFVKNRKWISADGKSEFARYIVGIEEWLPATSSQLAKGLGIADTKNDWEFLTAKPKESP